MAKKLAISNSALQACKCCTNCVQISSIMFCERRLFYHLDFFFFFLERPCLWPTLIKTIPELVWTIVLMKLIALLQPQKNLSPNMEAKESSKKFSLLTTVSLVRRLFLGIPIRKDTLIILAGSILYWKNHAFLILLTRISISVSKLISVNAFWAPNDFPKNEKL